MKNQYFGDINDYRKYALINAISGNGVLCTGVCWMLTESDGRKDGSALGYLSQPDRFRGVAPEIFDLLYQSVVVELDRRIARFESAGVLNNCVFFSQIIPDNRQDRAEYFSKANKSLDSADLIFYDPDNGLEVPSVPLGRRGSSKYLYWHEAEATYRSGKSLLIYQHFPRKKRSLFIQSVSASIAKRLESPTVFAFSTSRVVFFLVPQNHHIAQFRKCVSSMIDRWGEHLKVTEIPASRAESPTMRLSI